MRISDWSSDVCSSDLRRLNSGVGHHSVGQDVIAMTGLHRPMAEQVGQQRHLCRRMIDKARPGDGAEQMGPDMSAKCIGSRSEEHTSELQSLMRISYAVFCLKKKNKK